MVTINLLKKIPVLCKASVCVWHLCFFVFVVSFVKEKWSFAKGNCPWAKKPTGHNYNKWIELSEFWHNNSNTVKKCCGECHITGKNPQRTKFQYNYQIYYSMNAFPFWLAFLMLTCCTNNNCYKIWHSLCVILFLLKRHWIYSTYVQVTVDKSWGMYKSARKGVD